MKDILRNEENSMKEKNLLWTIESTYDDKGNVLKSERSDGYVCEWTYDDIGQELSRKDTRGNWEEKCYDENHRIISRTDSFKSFEKWIYDNSGNILTYTKGSAGITTEITENTYDDKNRVITTKTSSLYAGSKTHARCSEKTFDHENHTSVKKVYEVKFISVL